MDLGASIDGSPMDRNVFLVLILAALYVLVRRLIPWASILRHNFSYLIFFAFASLSILWADDSILALKRLVKSFGDVLMVLILLTEKRPFDALGLVLRRLAFVLLPLSILFIKYYPELGRSYHMGLPMFTGVAYQKNSLGQLCMIIAVYFAWLALLRRRCLDDSIYKPPLAILLIVSTMLVWLLMMAQSATALALTAGAAAFFAASSLGFFANRPGRLVFFGALTAVIIPLLEYNFHLKDAIIRLLGREPDLTGRTPIWDAVLQAVPNAWVGAGYESFWTADRLNTIGITQAHNGYVDFYANLGIIGIGLLLFAVFVGFVRAISQLRDDYTLALFRLVIVVVVMAYNYTEAAFKPMNNMYLLLLFGILSIPTRKKGQNTDVSIKRSSRDMVNSSDANSNSQYTHR